MTVLDVSNNTELTELQCYSNSLASLDVSGCTALTELYCYDNQLTTLNVSNNKELESLRCSSNQLKSLDVSQNTALTTLYCGGNPGDGESVFPVTVWADFNLNRIPDKFTKDSWVLDNGTTISPVYQKAQ